MITGVNNTLFTIFVLSLFASTSCIDPYSTDDPLAVTSSPVCKSADFINAVTKCREDRTDGKDCFGVMAVEGTIDNRDISYVDNKLKDNVFKYKYINYDSPDSDGTIITEGPYLYELITKAVLPTTEFILKAKYLSHMNAGAGDGIFYSVAESKSYEAYHNDKAEFAVRFSNGKENSEISVRKDTGNMTLTVFDHEHLEGTFDLSLPETGSTTGTVKGCFIIFATETSTGVHKL
jgi:hypothetical protein